MQGTLILALFSQMTFGCSLGISSRRYANFFIDDSVHSFIVVGISSLSSASLFDLNPASVLVRLLLSTGVIASAEPATSEVLSSE